MFLPTKKYFGNKIILIIVFSVFFTFCASGVVFAAQNQPTLPQMFTNGFKWAMSIAGMLALISFILGGIKYMTSAADVSAQGEGKDRMVGSSIGLVLLLASWLIMQSINPQIKSLDLFSGLPAGPGIYYFNGNSKEDKPANMQEADVSKMVPGYNKIKYVCTAGTGPNLLVWFYPKTFFRDDSNTYEGTNVVSVGCGKNTSITGASFKIEFERPGVFLFFNSGCKGYMSEAFTADTPIPEMYRGKIKSIKISNQIRYPDPDYTDYMIIFRDQKNINGASNCTPPLYLGTQGKSSDCIDVNESYTNSAYIRNLNDNSAVVHNANSPSKYINQGLVFFSKPWGGSPGAISGFQNALIDGFYIKNLWMSYKPSDIRFKYCTGVGTNDCESQNYQNICKTFADCPGSMQVKGKYLVILSTDPSYGVGWNPTNISVCQGFESNINSLKETEFLGKKNTIGSIFAIPLK